MKKSDLKKMVSQIVKEEISNMKEANVDLTLGKSALGGDKDRLGKFIQDNYQKLIKLISLGEQAMTDFLEQSKPSIYVSEFYWVNKFMTPLHQYFQEPDGRKRFARVAKFLTDVMLAAAKLAVPKLEEEFDNWVCMECHYASPKRFSVCPKCSSREIENLG